MRKNCFTDKIGVIMKKVAIFLLTEAIFLFGLFPAVALDLGVNDAVSLALENNVSIKREEIKLDALERAKKHSWNSISPSLSLSGGVAVPNDTKTYDYSMNIQGRVSLSFSPALFTSIQSAKIAYEQGEMTFEDTKRTISASVISGFYGLLNSKEQIALQKRNLETSKSQWERNKERYNQGRVSEIDVLNAEVGYKSLLPTVENAVVTYENDLASFKQILGIKQDEEIVLKGNLDELVGLKDKKIEITDEQFKNVPSVESLEKKLEAAKTALSASRVGAYSPSISAGWSYNPTWRIKDGNSTDSEGGSLSITATIPLDGFLPWSTGADRIASAKDTISDLEIQLENEKLNVRLSVDSSLRKIKQLQSTLQSQEKTIEVAQKNYEMTEQAYNLGRKSFTELQNASDSLLKNQTTFKSQIYSLVTSILALEKTLGLEFGSLIN